jgi:transposase
MRLNAILDEAGFDRFAEAQCEAFYAPVMGRPGLPPGRYFRLLLVGYFEGIDSERGIARRAADSLAVGSFLGLGPGISTWIRPQRSETSPPYPRATSRPSTLRLTITPTASGPTPPCLAR